jgi:glycosyltransferase involved in cell wall biosynthesis
MDNPPLVSVYIPTHNRSERLKLAVGSVLDQTYDNIEIIIIDDGSSDDTPETIRELKETHRNLSGYRFESAQGACSARNKGISLGTGEYITGLDDDDRFLPNRIADFVNSFDPAYSFLSTSYTVRDEQGRQKNIDKPTIVTENDIRKRNYAGNQVFVPRYRLLHLGGFDESLKAWQDYDLWYRLILEYGPAKVINNGSYEVDVTGDRDRITTSNNAHTGYQQFVSKHQSSLSSRELFYQELNDLYNRQVKLGIFSTLKRCRDAYSASRVIRLYLLTHWPKTIRLLLKK